MKYVNIRMTEDMAYRLTGELYKSKNPLLEMVAKDIDEQVMIARIEENAERKTA